MATATGGALYQTWYGTTSTTYQAIEVPKGARSALIYVTTDADLALGSDQDGVTPTTTGGFATTNHMFLPAGLHSIRVPGSGAGEEPGVQTGRTAQGTNSYINIANGGVTHVTFVPEAA